MPASDQRRRRASSCLALLDSLGDAVHILLSKLGEQYVVAHLISGTLDIRIRSLSATPQVA
jgi:hypothetical protein